jgi:alkanesulfonate monooxygenase SsuD/methylene tetrahydromethanopterin reductase-like flavin-dependent oxidoreductase (luciferase family)
MRLGISLPLNGYASPIGDVVSRDARAAEEAGFDSVWFFDSLGRGRMSLDPLIAVSVAAAATERIAVGIGILQVPIRHPVELAHRILTAQLLCEGRLLLGVGSGSTKGDFDAVGVNFDDRMRLLQDGLQTMRTLWAGRSFDGINLTPVAQLSGGPPLLIGSWAGERWIRKAAQEFDGWIASAFFSGLYTLEQGIKRYREAGGQRAIVTNISVDLESPTEPQSRTGDSFHLKCAPAAASERLGALAELGYDDAVVVFRGTGQPDLAMIRQLLGSNE